MNNAPTDPEAVDDPPAILRRVNATEGLWPVIKTLFLETDDEGLQLRRRTVADRIIRRLLDHPTVQSDGSISQLPQRVLEMSEEDLCRADQHTEWDRINAGALILAEGEMLRGGFQKNCPMHARERYIAAGKLVDLLRPCSKEEIRDFYTGEDVDREVVGRALGRFVQRMDPAQWTPSEVFYLLAMIGDFPEVRTPYCARKYNHPSGRTSLGMVFKSIGEHAAERAWLMSSVSEARREELRYWIRAMERRRVEEQLPREAVDSLIVEFTDGLSTAERIYVREIGVQTSRRKGRKSHDITLEHYLMCLNGVRTLHTTPPQRRDRDLWWSLLRQARVFDIPSEVANRLRIASMGYVLKRVLGLEEDAPVIATPVGQEITPEEKRRAAFLRTTANAIAPPAKLPFEVCYFGFGDGVPVVSISGKDAKDYLLGILVTKSGFVANIVNRFDAADLDIIRRPELPEWEPRMVDEPWFLLGLVDVLQDQRTFTIEGQRSQAFNRGYKNAAQHAKTDKNKLPEPYYLVTMRRDFQVKDAQEVMSRTPRPRRPLSHRFDVIEHDRARHYRGPVPMDPTRQRVLTRRGYTILTYGATIPAEIAEAMMRRELPPPKEGEWLAIKMWDVSQFIRGPENAPYIPSLRRLPPSGIA